MPELAFLGQHNRQLRSRYAGGNGGGRDVSPESVIFSIASSFSLFSSSASASASIERCSSASDVVDQDFIVSDVSQNLSGGLRDSSSARCLDPDPKNSFTVRKRGGQHLISKKVEKAKAIKECNDAETDCENQALYSARSSFSQTLKECQNLKSRSDILLRKSDRRRPASLDMNNQAINVTSSSPRLGLAMKSSVSARQSGMFPSPGTPNYRPTSIGVQKGWSSERVPLQTNGIQRQVSSTLVSYNSGRTLPSKWEDAERWIISPVAEDGALKPSVQQAQSRPKSKSGPLGPPGSAYNSMYSPAVPIYAGNGGSFVTGSPFPDGVNAGDGPLIQYQDGRENNGSFPSLTEPSMAKSVSLHGGSELLSQSLLRVIQDDKIDGFMDAATAISRDVSRRDMATQMSPDSVPYSSPRNNNSSPLSNSVLPIVDLQHIRSSKPDIRDVQVDDLVTLTKSSKKNKERITRKGSDIVDNWKRKALEVQTADWEVSEMTKSLSKIKREEAKITAWENLQKAKAEAAIRKLEMKLEKKRSSSMDKIMNKLRSAQKKAQEMRGSVLSNQSYQVARSSNKAASLMKTPQIRSLSGCFTCPAF